MKRIATLVALVQVIQSLLEHSTGTHRETVESELALH